MKFSILEIFGTSPLFHQIVMVVTNIVDKVSNWVTKNQDTVATLTSIFAVIGLVSGALVTVVGLFIMFGAIGAKLNEIGTGLSLIFKAISLVTGISAFWVILAVIGAIVVILGTLYKAWTENWGGIRDYVTEVVPKILGLVLQIGIKIVEIFGKLWDAVEPILKSFWENMVMPILKAGGNLAISFLELFLDMLNGDFSKVFITDLPKIVSIGIKAMIDVIAGFLKYYYDLQNTLTGGLFSGWYEQQKTWIGDTANLAKGLVDEYIKVKDTLETNINPISTPTDKFSGMFSYMNLPESFSNKNNGETASNVFNNIVVSATPNIDMSVSIEKDATRSGISNDEFISARDAAYARVARHNSARGYTA
jgi:hypothetical protein